MHIIVIGCGKVGSKLANVFAEYGHDVVIVDNDSNAFKALGPNFSGITVTGVPIDQDVLKHAGIETADALAAVTPDDNVNIMVSQVAKEIFKVPRVIARIYNPSREHVFQQFGLETICPTDITVEVIRARMMEEVCYLTHKIAHTEIGFKYEPVTDEYEGKKITSIKTMEDTMIFGVIRKENFMLANQVTKLESGDILVISGKTYK